MPSPGEEIVILEASEANVEAIASFFWNAWREAGPDALGWIGASEEVLKEISAGNHIAKRVGSADRRMFLAKEGERVVGLAANRRIDDETLELAGIIVLQSLLGRGIGSRLLNVAVDAARHDGYTRLDVMTEADNERAIAFYKEKGFALSETTEEKVESVRVRVLRLIRDL
ncbi:MAG: GNAT family N-acetyltransferase [Thermoplasmata archaeon]